MRLAVHKNDVGLWNCDLLLKSGEEISKPVMVSVKWHNISFPTKPTKRPDDKMKQTIKKLTMKLMNSQNKQPIHPAVVEITPTSSGSGSDSKVLKCNVDEKGICDFLPNKLKIGTYRIKVKAGGYYVVTSTYIVKAGNGGLENVKPVLMSPILKRLEGRIMMTWEQNFPKDLDLHVVSVKRSDLSPCRTYFNNRVGCEGIRMDQENKNGGWNGGEAITLLDFYINQKYIYVIAVEDYNFESGGEHFKKSGFEILLFSSKSGNDYKVKVDPKELARYTIEYRKK